VPNISSDTIDNLISRLSGLKKNNTVDYEEMGAKEVYFLCERAIDVFKSESVLLEIDGPIYICGIIANYI
jgi:hypothetical protein